MKELLLTMFRGWALREASWNGETYLRDEVSCMIEAAGGDSIKGQLLHLFDYWGNDIEALAPHYGIALERDAKGALVIREDVPPAPSPEHWWNEGKWNEPEAQEEITGKPVNG